jgi:hypothetical protein
VTEEAGIHFTYRNGTEANQYTILEVPGGGLAVLDYDGDGLLDLFLTGGGDFAGPDKKQIKGYPGKLYRNKGGWKFEDVTARVGLERPVIYTHGCAVADYDRDGWPDLLVTGWHRLALYRNLPVDASDTKKGRRFVEVSKEAGLPEGLWTTSAAWGDMDGDGYPDLYICQYVDWSFKNHPTDCLYKGGARDICSPRHFHGLPDKLFLNRGDGTFRDVSSPAGLRMPRAPQEYAQLEGLNEAARERLRQAETEDAGFGNGLGVICLDLNGDSKPDIYVTNDMVDNFLYLNRTKTVGKPLFEEKGMETGTARDAAGKPNASMGVAAADFNGTGRPSLFVTNYLPDDLHAVYANECIGSDELFQFSTQAVGLAAIGQASVGWGAGFLDLDLDGWEDWVYTAGDVYRNAPNHGRQRPWLFHNNKGRFQDISSQGGRYFREEHLGRGLVLADFDNDGRLDLAVSHLNEPVVLLRNVADTRGRHWLGVELQGKDHRDVVGAKITLEAGGRTQTRFAIGGGSYLSSGDRRHVFGLGDSTAVGPLTVTWPSGKQQTWKGLAIDRYHCLSKGGSP